MSDYLSPQIKLRELAQLDPTMQAIFGGGTAPKPAFRWFNRQMVPGVVADAVKGGTCVMVMNVGTVRGMNQGGVMNLEAPRMQFTIADLESEKARIAAEAIITFMGTVNLCVIQISSPVTAISSNPNIFLGQREGMIVNPQSPGGPVYTEIVEFRVYNRTDLAAA